MNIPIVHLVPDMEVKMGMLLNGRWTSDDKTIVAGAYIRSASQIHGAAKAETIDSLKSNKGRFLLIGSNSCPWSHRTTIIRSLKSLENIIPLHIAHGERIEGYALDDGKYWTVPRTAIQIKHLHELYSLHNNNYTGRATVPVLWDSKTSSIVSNESAEISKLLDALPEQAGYDFVLHPDNLKTEIDAANEWIYQGLNNAVYRAGFAETQSAYEKAVELVFKTLDRLEKRLAISRYYFGNALTETDIRIFPTLIRFDSIYYILFKCSRRRLIDYPNLWGYARDLHSWQGMAETVDFETMRRASYRADSRDPMRLVAVAPDMNWLSDHDRTKLGQAFIIDRNGKHIPVEPARFKYKSSAG